nr:hypothetical protein [Bradyrhizobium lablabi]
MPRLFLFSALLLAGCGSTQSTYQAPVVDMAGVDQNRYVAEQIQADLALLV